MLCRRGYVTMRALADELGVSQRTIQRDIDAISIEIPVFTKRGKHGGGVYIEESYRAGRPHLSAEESALLYKVADVLKTVRCGAWTVEDQNALLALLEKISKK